jgi:hypothetical protein
VSTFPDHALGTVVSVSVFQRVAIPGHVRRRGERQRRDDLGLPLSINFNLLTLDRGSNDAVQYKSYADLAEHLRDLGANLRRTDDRVALLGVRDQRRCRAGEA